MAKFFGSQQRRRFFRFGKHVNCARSSLHSTHSKLICAQSAVSLILESIGKPPIAPKMDATYLDIASLSQVNPSQKPNISISQSSPPLKLCTLLRKLHDFYDIAIIISKKLFGASVQRALPRSKYASIRTMQTPLYTKSNMNTLVSFKTNGTSHSLSQQTGHNSP